MRAPKVLIPSTPKVVPMFADFTTLSPPRVLIDERVVDVAESVVLLNEATP